MRSFEVLAGSDNGNVISLLNDVSPFQQKSSKTLILYREPKLPHTSKCYRNCTNGYNLAFPNTTHEKEMNDDTEMMTKILLYCFLLLFIPCILQTSLTSLSALIRLHCTSLIILDLSSWILFLFGQRRNLRKEPVSWVFVWFKINGSAS